MLCSCMFVLHLTFMFMLFSALMKGIESHKKIDLSGNPILRYYYTDRVSFQCLCSGFC